MKYLCFNGFIYLKSFEKSSHTVVSSASPNESIRGQSAKGGLAVSV